MYFVKLYSFASWANWGETIRDGMRDFYDEFKIYPLYLLANSYTFSQIDFVGQHEIDPHMKPEFPEDKEGPIGGIKFYDREVTFGVEDNIQDKSFLLLFSDEIDDGNDGQNEPQKSPPNLEPSKAKQIQVKANREI
jgi:hypothetical protein